MPRSSTQLGRLFATFLTAGLVCAPLAAAPPASIPMPTGNPDRGHTVFRRARCSACHVIDGVSVRSDFDQPILEVILGGADAPRLSDTQLATEIVLPSHQVKAIGVTGRKVMDADSPMPNFARSLSVQDVADLVALLRPAYRRQRRSRFLSGN